MQPSEALGVAAQVAVTLAGFAGIVVIFRPDSVHRWSPLDKFRLQLLLTNSALPLADALFGMFLLTFDPPPVSIWRWCSGVGFCGQLFVIVYSRKSTRLFIRPELQTVNRFLFYGMAFIGTVAMALQAINFSVWNLFWPFFALVFVHLIAALVQFVRMVLLPPHKSSVG
ncbi:MAG TPA: hypothetical protein VHW03_03500 [Chthoniobacterales bacterium]|jgi:hypothetical protein|nr:hypothetical protein [Chthoniobacterales bacterium]